MLFFFICQLHKMCSYIQICNKEQRCNRINQFLLIQILKVIERFILYVSSTSSSSSKNVEQCRQNSLNNTLNDANSRFSFSTDTNFQTSSSIQNQQTKPNSLNEDSIYRDPALCLNPNYSENSKQCQPVMQFPKSCKKRSFTQDWYSTFNWIEYSVSLDAAFCFSCRHFTQKSSNNN